MKDSMDFELEIERVGERYRAKVRKAPIDFGAKCWFDLKPEALEELSFKIENLREIR